MVEAGHDVERYREDLERQEDQDRSFAEPINIAPDPEISAST